MDNDKIIYKAKSTRFSPYSFAIVIIIGTYIIYPAENLFISLLLGVVIFIFISVLLKKYHEIEIEITESKIELKSHFYFRKAKKESLVYSEIQNVKYNRGAYRQDSAMYITTKSKLIKEGLIPNNTFEFGHVLRFLKTKGIKIQLVHSDHELRMYIDGKIDQFPMNNETEIKSNKNL